ncbi:helix-turn-helix transcriptional regulator [Clostridium sp. 001]|uniref:helix-turn-helix transcriptional regulator n=1 Tax=Clostridium sp. 001 TaxID=1970093 RepID=UPI001C2C230A|nr:helix-turn-helix transcriptional regulator [Clostridium sp. 001]QXE20425.1 transcriptional regulator [Clostridium sp. 001]
MNKSFSERLKAYRKELSIKRNEKVGQVQLANELGISKGAIGNLESGDRIPSKAILIKLVEHSKKSLEYWMNGVENYEAPNTVDLVLDKMIEKNVIKKGESISNEAWEIIKEAVELEIERKLQ